jgi:hypothetical protein
MQCKNTISWLQFVRDTNTTIPTTVADVVVTFLRKQGRPRLHQFLCQYLGSSTSCMTNPPQSEEQPELSYYAQLFLLYQDLYMDPCIPVDMDYQTGTVFLLLCRSILYAKERPQELSPALLYDVCFMADLFMMCFSAAFI